MDKSGDNGDQCDHSPGRASFQVQADLQNPGKESQREALRGQQVDVIIVLLIIIVVIVTIAFIIMMISGS